MIDDASWSYDSSDELPRRSGIHDDPNGYPSAMEQMVNRFYDRVIAIELGLYDCIARFLPKRERVVQRFRAPLFLFRGIGTQADGVDRLRPIAKAIE